ncbi:MAG: hypothetical protein ABSA13_14835 [Beijerinckiaceae bacterium]|jgi:hypothetical protein
MRLALSALIVIAATGTAFAAKNTRFWNLTENTITTFQIAPAGTDKWGENQTKNDKDNAVDHDERLKITGVSDGTYDIRLSDAKGRTCFVKNVAIREGDVFSIEEKQLTDCSKK